MSELWEKYFNDKAYILSCPIVDSSNNKDTTIGTATYLMPGIFLTASHVVKEWHSRSSGDTIIPSDQPLDDVYSGLTVSLYHLLNGKKVIQWKVTKSLSMPDYDISVLICEHFSPEASKLLEEHVFQPTSIDLHVPKIDQPVSALGYPFTKTTPLGGGYLHKLNLRAAIGGVEEVYLSGVGLVKSPCFQINAEIKGGMSGGPVFNKEGRLCGIISSGYDPTEEHPLYTILISLLWQVLIAPLETSLWGGATMSILDASEGNYIEVIGKEHITNTGGQFAWSEIAPSCVVCNPK